MLGGMFKKTNYVPIASEAAPKQPDSTESAEARPNVPEGLFLKCKKCRSVVYTKDIKDNLFVCPECGLYNRVSACDRIDMVIDEGTFEEWDSVMDGSDPLEYPGYPEKIEELKAQTGLSEAVVTGHGRIEGMETAIAVMDARFMMASMGHVVGEKITRAIEKATRLKLPVIIFCCSGGARMQEGMVSLMQMAKTSAALKRHGEAGLPYFSIITDPTTGGVTASFAMLGDVILAEPEALIGFAGQRVIEQTICQKLPKGFQRAEFALQHGLIDAIVERKDMKHTLAHLIKTYSAYEAPAKQFQEKEGE